MAQYTICVHAAATSYQSLPKFPVKVVKEGILAQARFVSSILPA